MSARTAMPLSILPSILPFRQDTDHESRLLSRQTVGIRGSRQVRAKILISNMP